MRSTTASEPPTQATEASPLDVLGVAWAAEVLLCLHEGPAHFNALRRRLDGLSASTLSARLGELGGGGMVTRTERGDRPARVVYALTEHGHRVATTLRTLDAMDGAEQQR